MVLALQSGGVSELGRAIRRDFPRVLAIAALLVVLLALASTYVGHAASPYGTCYAPSGRAIPCELVSKDR